MSTELLIDRQVKNSASKKGAGQGPPPMLIEPPYEPNGEGDSQDAKPVVNNAYVAMLLFIGADVMFFAGLIGAFIVFRFGAIKWPPLGQPRLPVEVTGLNTAILLSSGYTMLRAWRAARPWQLQKLLSALTLTAALGSTFLFVQGYEWTRMLQFGLTLSSGVYGGTFYVLIGCHALHVLGALVWLLVVLNKTKREMLLKKPEVSVRLAGMYWFLVVALWPVLYSLVYL